MGICDRKQRQKEAIRSSILEASWSLVQKEGWQSLSIRKIAEAIDYSVPVIYDHFENKEALLLEFTRHGFQKLNEVLTHAIQSHSDPEEQIEAVAYAYWQFAFTHKEYYQLMYGLGMQSCEMVRSIPEVQQFTQLLLESMKRLIDNAGNKEAHAFLKLQTFWSTLHGLISINMMGKDPGREELNEMVLKDFIRSFITGIKA
ncbi:MAG TPA: TetR/AcrR family transcriptional regulator [Flavisolibacter sp.]|jgi:AcrR family transcriptional regulator|nr:TetR/AcrR family transcriptional regulator [Flavisolibacter sp.]